MQDMGRENCEALLARNKYGRLGCYSPDEHQVYVVPISYDFHDGAVYFSSINGEKVEYLRAHPKGICLEVDEIEDGLSWTSVIVRGDFVELHGDERLSEREPALARAKAGPMHWLFDADVPERGRDALVIAKMVVRDMSGRREHFTWERQAPVPLRFLSDARP